MKSRSNNLKLGGGVAAVALLAGVGVLVWTLGFRGERTSAGIRPTASTQSFIFALHGVNATRYGERGNRELDTAPLTAAEGLVSAGDTLVPQTGIERLDFGIPTEDATSFEDGVKLFDTAMVQETAPIVSAGDLLFSNASFASPQSFSPENGQTAPSVVTGIEIPSNR